MRELFSILRSGISLSKLIDPRAYLVFVPLLILTSTLSNARWDDPVGLAIWFSANTIALSLGFALLAALKKAVGKLQRPPHVKLAGILATGFLLGFSKTIFTLLFAEIMLTQSVDLVDIIRRSALVAPVALSLVCVVVWIAVARERYLANRDAVIAARIADATSTDQQGGATARFQQELTAKIADEITNVRERLFGGGSISTLVDQARELRDLAEYTVRPISHQIWSEQSKRVNDFSLRQLAQLGVRSTPFAPLIFTLIIAPGLLYWVTSSLGFEAVLTKGLPALAATLVVQWAFSAWGSGSSKGWVRFSLGLGLPAIASTLLIYFDSISQDPITVLNLFLTLFVWYFSTGLLIAIFRAGIRARADLNQELAQVFGPGSLESASLTSLSRFESRRIAQALHSNVQNKLLSAAMRLEGEQSLSRDELDAQLSLLESMVRELGTLEPLGQSRSIGESIELVRADWKGFLEVLASGDLDIKPALGNEIIQQILTEAIGNAKRHGKANSVAISVTQEPEGLKLEIVDDGIGTKKSTAGMGFGLFRSISPDQFSFESEASGSKLTLLLPN